MTAAVLLLLVLLQFLQTILNFEPVSGILNDEPLYPLDFSIGYYMVESANQKFQENGHFHGYDPYFMAGYPELYLHNNHILLIVLARLLSPFLASALLIKLFYVVTLTAVPLLLFVCFRKFDVGNRGALAGTLLGMTYVRVGEFVIMETGGSPCGVLLFPFTLMYLSFLYRVLKYDEKASAVFFAVMSPILPLLHKGLVIILPVPMLSLLWVYRSRISPRHLFSLVSLGVIALTANAFWMIPAIRSRLYETGDPAYFWLNLNPWNPLLDYLLPRAGGFPTVLRGCYGTLFTKQLVLVLAVLGFRWLWKQRERKLVVVMGCSAVFYLLFANYASFFPALRQVEPYRFIIWMNMLLLVPASHALGRFLDAPECANRMNRLRFRATGLVGVVLLLNVLPSCRSLLRIHPRRTVAAGYLDEFLKLKDWVRGNTDTKSRILIEDAYAPFMDTREGPFMDSYPLGILALETRRELLSAGYAMHRISFRHASWIGGQVFGKPLETVDPVRLRLDLDLYNCGWVITFNQRSVEILRTRFSFLHEEEQVGPFVIFRVRDPVESFFLKGSGTISSSFAGIHLKDLKPDAGEVILKYHFVRGMRAEPPLQVQEVYVSDDPNGFIRLWDPPAAVKLAYP